MKKLIIILLSLFSFINLTFANFINNWNNYYEISKNKIIEKQKEIQKSFWISLDIYVDWDKEQAKSQSTADIMLWINIPEHKMQDFSRENLQPIFYHTDLDSCRSSMKSYLRNKDFNWAFISYENCIYNKLNTEIDKIKEKAKRYWVKITSNNLFEVKKYLSKIKQKENKILTKETEKRSKILKYLLLFIIFIIFIVYLSILYFFKKEIKKQISILDKNLIYLFNLKYLDIVNISKKINILKERLYNLKNSYMINKKDLEYLKKEVKKISNEVLEMLENSKGLKEETKNLKKEFDNLF